MAEVTGAILPREVKFAPATVSRIIDRRVRAERRQRARGETDRRRVCVSLTARGLERLQSVPVPLQEQFVRRFNALPEEKREMVLNVPDTSGRFRNMQDRDASPILAPGDVLKQTSS